MAEREDEEQGQEEQPKKKIPLMVIALGGQTLLLFGAAGFLGSAALKIDKPRLTQEKMVERAIAGVRDDLSQISIIPLDEFSVNMDGTNTVIQTKINVEVSNQAAAN